MKMRTIALSAFFALATLITPQTSYAASNEQCSPGPIVGGKQTIRLDGQALFFDMKVRQPNGSDCIVRAAIDISKKNINEWKTYITDETMADDNEVLDNIILSGSMVITSPGVATINVKLQEVNSGKVWDFPQFTLIARPGKTA